MKVQILPPFAYEVVFIFNLQVVFVFTTGQMVVYPAQGVGVIERIESQELGGIRAEFYIVNIMCNNIHVLVPVKNATNTGLRPLSTPTEAESVLDNLKNYQKTQVHAGQNWNRRQREYTEKLKAGTLETVGSVLKELILISSSKELSFGEKRLLEQSMNLISGELSHVLKRDGDDIKKTINEFYVDLFPPESKENPPQSKSQTSKKPASA